MGIYSNAYLGYGIELDPDWVYERRTAECDEEFPDELPEFELDPYGDHPNAKRLEELGLELDIVGDCTYGGDATGYVIVVKDATVWVSSSCEFTAPAEIDKLSNKAAQVTGGVSRDSNGVKIYEFMEELGLRDAWKNQGWMVYWSRG